MGLLQYLIDHFLGSFLIMGGLILVAPAFLGVMFGRAGIMEILMAFVGTALVATGAYMLRKWHAHMR